MSSSKQPQTHATHHQQQHEQLLGRRRKRSSARAHAFFTKLARRIRPYNETTDGPPKVQYNEPPSEKRQLSSSSSSWTDEHDHLLHPFEFYKKHGRTRRAEEEVGAKTFEPIRMHFETSSIDASNFSAKDVIRINALRGQILPRVEERLSSAISVVRATSPIPISQETCFGLLEDALPEHLLTNNHAKDGSTMNQQDLGGGGGVDNADLVLFVLLRNRVGEDLICCDDCGTLAAAGACELDQYDRPMTGLINICLNEIPLEGDVEGEETQISSSVIDTVVSTVEHELTHVLGFHSEMYRYFRHPHSGEPLTPRPFCEVTTPCVGEGELGEELIYDDILLPATNTLRTGRTDAGKLYYQVVTPTLLTVARNQYGCQSLEGVRLENQPTSALDCFGSHFEEKVSYDETMSAFFQEEGVYFSALTMALLEDTGWYRANYTMAEKPRFGHQAGCNFLEQNCIRDGGVVPDFGKGYFCDLLSEVDVETDEVVGTYVCDPSHTHRAMCDLFDLSLLEGFSYPPRDHRYFNSPTYGPTFTRAEWCPIPSYNIIDCRDPSSHAFSSGILPGETFAPNSLCFNTQTVSTSRDGGVGTTTTTKESVCLVAECDASTRSLHVVVAGLGSIVCKSDFEVHAYPGREGLVTVECPRLAAVCPHFFCPMDCSGRGVCKVPPTTTTNTAAAATTAEAASSLQCSCFDEKDETPACSETRMLGAEVETVRQCSSFGWSAAAGERRWYGGMWVTLLVMVVTVLLCS